MQYPLLKPRLSLTQLDNDHSNPRYIFFKPSSCSTLNGMITLRNIKLTFNTQVIFDNLSCSVNEDDRIGLVGLNGSGKSTLLRIIAGKQTVDEGVIEKTSRHTIGYLPQDITLASTKNVVDEAISACTFDETEEGATRAQAKKILAGLGFSPAQCEQSVNTLSVGWKMRLVLAQLLLLKADFYLFDEPTNHLDLVAKQWFLDFLKQSSFGFMLVCHDRYFLDQLCTITFDIEGNTCTRYRGNYTSYCTQKRHHLDNVKKAFIQQQKDIARKQKTIERFRASAGRARMAKKMERDLDRIERITLPPEPKNIHFEFPAVKQSGKIVLTVHNVSQHFDQQRIFEHISFDIERGQRVALIAPNGTGKTTLLNLIAGKYPLQKGSIKFGFNVTKAFFEQDHMSKLEPFQTILETVSEQAPNVQTQFIKNMLGGFLFSNVLINKKIEVLSGGEKNRVSMICTLLQQANFLLLDEPTNHLDIPSKDILLNALLQYQGTMLFVSHDQDFVNRLATHIIELTPQRATTYIGNYEEYVYQKNHTVIPDQPTVTAPIEQQAPSSNKEQYLKRKELARLEQKITRLEQTINELQERLGSLIYGTKEFARVTQELQEKQTALTQCWTEWETFIT